LFQEHIARAWANVLQDAQMQVADIYAFWPPRTDASMDWKDIETKTLINVLNSKLSIWPLHPASTSSPALFSRFDDALIDISDTDPKVLAAVAKAGVRIIRPPDHVVRLIKDARLSIARYTYTTVTSETVSQKLQVLYIHCFFPRP
jgi:hypothetical protein